MWSEKGRNIPKWGFRDCQVKTALAKDEKEMVFQYIIVINLLVYYFSMM